MSTLTAERLFAATGGPSFGRIDAAAVGVGERPAAALGVERQLELLVATVGQWQRQRQLGVAAASTDVAQRLADLDVVLAGLPADGQGEQLLHDRHEAGPGRHVVQGLFVAGSIDESEPSVATRIERPRWIGSSTIAGSPPSKARATLAFESGVALAAGNICRPAWSAARPVRGP